MKLKTKSQNNIYEERDIEFSKDLIKQVMKISKNNKKLLNDVKEYSNIAIQIANECVKEFGIEYGDIVLDLFEIVISTKDKSALLIYDRHNHDETIIVRDKVNQRVFATKTKRYERDCDYYTEEDYINMEDIDKIYDIKRILHRIKEGADVFTNKVWNKLESAK